MHLLLSVVERRGLVVELRLDERVVVLQESEKKSTKLSCSQKTQEVRKEKENHSSFKKRHTVEVFFLFVDKGYKKRSFSLVHPVFEKSRALFLFSAVQFTLARTLKHANSSAVVENIL